MALTQQFRFDQLVAVNQGSPSDQSCDVFQIDAPLRADFVRNSLVNGLGLSNPIIYYRTLRP